MARKPLLTYFSETELDMILKEAHKVLDTTGIYLPHEKAKKLLKQAGAKEKAGDMITIPPQLVKAVLADSKPRFKLYNQTGTDFLEMEIGNTFYGPGSDLQRIRDMETEELRLTKLEDMAQNVSIVDSLPQYDFLMSMGLPSDVASKDVYKEAFKIMVLNSDKPIIATATNFEDIKKVYEIGVKVAGGEKALSEKPFFATYLEPVSPLKIEGDIADRIMFCAEKGVPYLFAAGANIAIQAPGSPETSIIQGTAESLSGLVLGYLVNPEVKFIFGANSAGFDGNKGIVSYGGPEWSKTMAYYAEIARKLNLPSWGFAGATDSNKLDAQAGYEAAQSIMMAEMSGSTLVHDVGYLGHGELADQRYFILNAEMIDRTRWMANRKGIIPGDAAPIIDDVANGRTGTFLDSEHTFKNHKTRYHPPKWVDRDLHSDEQATLLEKLKGEVYKILENRNPVTDAEVPTKMQSGVGAGQEPKEQIEIHHAEEVHTLDELFKQNPDKPEAVKEFLEKKLDAGESPNDLYTELVGALESNIEDTDLVFQLAYGRLFDNVADTILSKMDYNTEGTPMVLATVEGDVHYVGKNLVAQLAGVSGYKVIDTGIDVKTGEILLSTFDNEASLIGLSALLTTTRDNMKKTVDGLKSLGIKDQAGVIVGGAVIDQAYAKSIGADIYTRNAGDAAKALNSIKDPFIGNYERKNISDEKFQAIGESINSISKKVKTAMENKDAETILEIASRQVTDNAAYLDVAVSHLSDIDSQKEAIKWVVKTLQDKFDDTPLCLDSDDYRVVEAGLEAYDHTKSTALINSATLDKKRLENMVGLAADYKSNIVFQAAEGQTVESKMGMVDQFIEYAAKKGIPTENIFIDPGLETMAHNPDSARMALQTISGLKDKYPELHYTIGLTNIGYGLGTMSKTKPLQQAFLMAAKRAGLDSAITNPKICSMEFQDRKKALSESIEFLVGSMEGTKYAQKIEDKAYETK